jgi:hypothetical protein
MMNDNRRLRTPGLKRFYQSDYLSRVDMRCNQIYNLCHRVHLKRVVGLLHDNLPPEQS